LVATAEIDEIWYGYDLVEYPESPLIGPPIEETHTEWELLDEVESDPMMAAPVETDVEGAPTVTTAAPETETALPPAAQPAPATETVDDTPAAVVPDTTTDRAAQIDYSASLAAADAILSEMPDPESKAAAVLPAPVEPSNIDLFVVSSVRAGTLTLLVDNSEVLSRELVSARRARQTFDTTLSVDSGKHRVVARLELTKEGFSYENSIVVDIEEGEKIELDLLAGRSGRHPIVLTQR
jgi:hypothetical protein